MPASRHRRRHFEGTAVTCHPRRRARPALPREGEELHVRPVPRRAARGLVPARRGAGGAQGRGGTGRHLRKRAAPKVQYSRRTARNTLAEQGPFFLTLASRGLLKEERPAPIRGCRDLLGPRPERWLAIDAPENAPVYPTRAPPTPSTRHLLPPVAKEVGRNWESQQRQHYAPRRAKARDGDARGHK